MRERRTTSWVRLLCCALLTAVFSACGSESSDLAKVEPEEWLPGGSATNTLLLGSNAFTPPVSNISNEHELLFFSGNGVFNQAWVQAPSSTTGRDGLGALFNARSCSACHAHDGRGRPPINETEPFVSLLLKLSIPGQIETGEPLPDPNYGHQLAPFALPDVPVEGTPKVTYSELHGNYADATSYTLLSPHYYVEDLGYGSLDPNVLISPRVAPAVIGMGLLEAIPLERLEALEDTYDRDADGISGRINWVWDLSLNDFAAGRFGWKAEQPTVRQQSAAAFVSDIGITSSMFEHEQCMIDQPECTEVISGGTPEISDSQLDLVERYTQLLAVPVREEWKTPTILKGKKLFHQAQCASCHVPSHQTSSSAILPELANQKIFPFTDLLLHDMGDGLADNRPSFGASGREWRTPPLWGLRLFQAVNGHERLLHDGRARGVAEAILWHGGEAQTSRDMFAGMSKERRDALIAYVESL